jgi:hypothetical protein
MGEELPERPVLEYATPGGSEVGGAALLAHMRRWRSYTAIGVLIALVSSLAFSGVAPLGFLGFAIGLGVFLVGAVMTLMYMTRAAAREVDRAYAARHLILAILLLPIFFLGVFFVPTIVESDLARWQREDESGD